MKFERVPNNPGWNELVEEWPGIARVRTEAVDFILRDTVDDEEVRKLRIEYIEECEHMEGYRYWFDQFIDSDGNLDHEAIENDIDLCFTYGGP